MRRIQGRREGRKDETVFTSVGPGQMGVIHSFIRSALPGVKSRARWEAAWAVVALLEHLRTGKNPLAGNRLPRPGLRAPTQPQADPSGLRGNPRACAARSRDARGPAPSSRLL